MLKHAISREGPGRVRQAGARRLGRRHTKDAADRTPQSMQL